jgi:hypothetical protein
MVDVFNWSHAMRYSKRKSDTGKKRPARYKNQTENSEVIPVLHVRKGATLKEMYAAARAAFTAADLQKFTEIEEGIPAEELLRELEAMDEENRQLKKKRKNGKRGS